MLQEAILWLRGTPKVLISMLRADQHHAPAKVATADADLDLHPTGCILTTALTENQASEK